MIFQYSVAGVYIRLVFCLSALLFTTASFCQSGNKNKGVLKSKHMQVEWSKRHDGKWMIEKISGVKGNKTFSLENGTGAMTVLYSPEKPLGKADSAYRVLLSKTFREGVDKHAVKEFDKVLNSVSLNTEGQEIIAYPDSLSIEKGTIYLVYKTDYGTIYADWQIGEYEAGNDIHISVEFIANKEGYFSIASTDMIKTKEDDLKWATIPGYFHGNKFQSDFALAYGYGHGIPDKPVVFRDRCATTLTSILSRKDGLSLGATIEPGYSRDPWSIDKITHQDWHVGLSIMNREGNLSPTLYYPVLGEHNSAMNVGESVRFRYRYSISTEDWYSLLSHAINDIYKFPEALKLRENKQSLINRVYELEKYVAQDETSLWVEDEFQGKHIGAQSYFGPVIGADKDAIKNSDYGAMWMLANISSDTALRKSRLPYARNFKLVQQQTDSGFFQGAAVGQYYLTKSKKFTEEWGHVVEPIGLTYYTMLDIGNILLFEPKDTQLKQRLRLGAEALLRWQKEDGSWEVAYDRDTKSPDFTDLKDFRPTFYGLLVAYRVLKDQKYLDAAKKGADWYLKEGINNGSFIGVCGDIRYIADFATVQTAQCFLDLYDMTKELQYKEAAIKAAKIYVSSIYTHPIASNEIKTVKNRVLRDWEVTQTGLSFEHGGNFGSATTTGPILLASHAGTFVRMYELTNDQTFLNMARSAAIGREAFVNPTTNVASYYWANMDAGAGPYPHHAWWQIGWIMDYLLSEAHLRSSGQISFPRGFVTPKVGPHQSYGFASGNVNGEEANLRLFQGLINLDNPNIEHLTAVSTDEKKIYIILMNDLGENGIGKLTIDATLTKGGKYTIYNGDGQKMTHQNNVDISIAPYGLSVYTLALE